VDFRVFFNTSSDCTWNLRARIEKKVIWIDSELTADANHHQFNFTVAHEIGHLALHRFRPVLNYNGHEDTDEDLATEFNHEASSRGIAEWQANRYSAALLMPRSTVQVAIYMRQTEMKDPISINLGRVYLDDSPTNRRLYGETLSFLSILYKVSRTVVRIRLDELGLVFDQRTRKQTRTIGEAFLDKLF
jgi:Zn-dependent peptidase ImmA (M78 family)